MGSAGVNRAGVRLGLVWALLVFALSATQAGEPAGDKVSAKTSKKSSKPEVEPEMDVLGWVENAWLLDPLVPLKAKLDTGAETSSLHAIIVKRFREDGKRWVRFEVEDPETGEKFVLVRERKRTIGIVQHEGENEVRPVVGVQICISGHIQNIQVSLTDRGQFNYPLLLGRKALRQFTYVDPGHTFLGNDDCEKHVTAGEQQE